jgi:hypothetical protein
MLLRFAGDSCDLSVSFHAFHAFSVFRVFRVFCVFCVFRVLVSVLVSVLVGVLACVFRMISCGGICALSAAECNLLPRKRE